MGSWTKKRKSLPFLPFTCANKGPGLRDWETSCCI